MKHIKWSQRFDISIIYIQEFNEVILMLLHKAKFNNTSVVKEFSKSRKRMRFLCEVMCCILN